MKYEVGGPICTDGKSCFVPSLHSQGHPNKVNIPTACPNGSRTIGLYHTHPGGRAVPSQADVRNLRAAGLDVSCISDNRVTRCYVVHSRSKSHPG